MLHDRRVEEARQSFAPAALICSIIAETKRNPDKRSEPFTPLDFMPRAPSDEQPERKPEDIVARLQALQSMLGGTITDGQDPNQGA